MFTFESKWVKRNIVDLSEEWTSYSIVERYAFGRSLSEEAKIRFVLIILSRRRSKQWFELSETLIFLRLNIEVPEGGDDKELAL